MDMSKHICKYSSILDISAIFATMFSSFDLSVNNQANISMLPKSQ